MASPFLNVHHNPLCCCWESMSVLAVLNYLLHANHHQHVTHPETAPAGICSRKQELFLLINLTQESVHAGSHWEQYLWIQLSSVDFELKDKPTLAQMKWTQYWGLQPSSFWSSLQCSVYIKWYQPLIMETTVFPQAWTNPPWPFSVMTTSLLFLTKLLHRTNSHKGCCAY